MKMKFNTNILISFLLCLSLISLITANTAEMSSNTFEERNRNLEMTSNTLPGRNKKEFPMTTPLKDGKKGNFFELAKHAIICPGKNQALGGFQLYGKFHFVSNRIAYQWRCHKAIIDKSAKVTKGKYDGKKIKVELKNPVKTLENLKFKCKKNQIMKGFVMQKIDNNFVTTKTQCVEAKVKECQKESLKFKNINFGFVGKASVSQLGQFKLDLQPWQALQEVKGDYEKGDFRYRIKWCNIGSKPARAYAEMAAKAEKGKKMKVLYSNPATLKVGDEYCQKNCKINLTEKSRKCLEYGVIGCSVCDSALKPNDPKYKYSQSICQTFCNKYQKSEHCRFYEFKIVVKKKKIDSNALKAFNLAMVAHKNVKG